MAFTWNFIASDAEGWDSVPSLDLLPTNRPIEALGLSLSEGSPFFSFYPDEGVRPFAEETLDGVMIGWEDGPFSAYCQIPKSVGTICLSTDKNLVVPPLAGVWEAPVVKFRPTYTDGQSPFMQEYSELDRGRLKAFALTDIHGTPVVSVVLSPGERLIWRRRVFLTEGQGGVVVYLAGLQKTVEGRNYQAMFYVPETCSPIMLAGRFRKYHPIFYAIQPIPGEY